MKDIYGSFELLRSCSVCYTPSSYLGKYRVIFVSLGAIPNIHFPLCSELYDRSMYLTSAHHLVTKSLIWLLKPLATLQKTKLSKIENFRCHFWNRCDSL